ncbi:zinc metalloprotease [Larkinella bovis]|uniref:Zinc metalloprotease n=1 Tax=Larkinella bovis TaxID=683041 RepID=A0ABW0I791_9BACT
MIFRFSRKVARAACFLLVVRLFMGCQPENPVSDPVVPGEEIIRIPVVVHVLYNKDEFNISDEKIASQLAVLNQDFRKKNPDHTATPAEFAHLVADVGIEFYLATKDPDGKPTSGITRTRSTVDGWDGKTPGAQQPIDDLALYFTSQGGHDAWPADRYLNIWVAELSNRNGELALAGYAQFPGGDARLDGVVVDPRVFGTLPPLVEEHRLGRTTTHEIGHWLNLIHIFANSGNCQSTDQVDDTPAASGPYTGKPTYPQYACGQSSLFMNFMDNVDDEAMYMFTSGQKARMRAVFAPGGGREALYKALKSQ